MGPDILPPGYFYRRSLELRAGVARLLDERARVVHRGSVRKRHEGTMTEKIRAAMTPEQWAHVFREQDAGIWHLPGARNVDECAAMIAAYNAALPDSDRRKFTRAHVDALRTAARAGASATTELLSSLADALESYLPPE